MLITESFVLAQRAFAETLIGLAAATFEGIKKLGELNVQAARDIATEAGRAPQIMPTLINPQALITLQLSFVEARVQRLGTYCFRLQEIVTSAGSEASEAVRAGTVQIQSTLLAANEMIPSNSVVDALHASAQVGPGVPSAHDASDKTQIPASRTNSARTVDPATNKNGGRARDASDKSFKRSDGSGSGSASRSGRNLAR